MAVSFEVPKVEVPSIEQRSIEQRRAALRVQYGEWVPRTLDGFLDRCAEEFGDRPFVITDDRAFTYAEIAEWSQRIADGLGALGVRPGDHVGLLMANHPEFVAVKFAIARTGAVAVPLNYSYRQDELGYVLAQSECSVLVSMTAFENRDYPAALDAVAAGWDTGSATSCPALRHVVLLPTGGRRRDGVLTLDELADLGERHAGSSTGVSASPQSVGDMLYTSGSTGSPKGVLVTHDAVLRTAYASALTRAFEDGRRILFALPCYHMFGYEEGLLAVMFVGGAIIPQTKFDPLAYFRGIEEHRATDILCVPTMTAALLEHPDRDKFDLSSLSAALSGSAPSPGWLWEGMREELGTSEIVTGYGMTECGGAMTLSLPEDDLARTADTVGRPKMAGAAALAGVDDLVEYATVDPVTGANLEPHEAGELVSRGPATMVGFWGKPEETALTVQQGWVRSGDLGRVREDGYIEVTGRSKELYKSGGELVMPKEIEELLAQHPAVSQVFLVGLPDERWGESGCACVVRAPEAELTAADVTAMCKEKLAAFKVPKHVLFLQADELPTTATGKVRKFRLVEWAQQRMSETELVEPGGASMTRDEQLPPEEDK